MFIGYSIDENNFSRNILIVLSSYIFTVDKASIKKLGLSVIYDV